MAYVYAILINGVVRYVGKGTGRRSATHVKSAAKINRQRDAGEVVRTTRFYNELAKSLRTKQAITVQMLAVGLTDEEAICLEIQTIADAPLGQLYNSTDGGPGLTSTVAKKIWEDPEYRAQQMTVGQKARLDALWADPAFRERASVRAKKIFSGIWCRPGFRVAHKAAVQRKWRDDTEFRERKTRHNREIAVANNARPEKKKQQSALATAMNADKVSEFNERRLNGLRIAKRVSVLKRLGAEMRAAYERSL